MVWVKSRLGDIALFSSDGFILHQATGQSQLCRALWFFFSSIKWSHRSIKTSEARCFTIIQCNNAWMCGISLASWRHLCWTIDWGVPFWQCYIRNDYVSTIQTSINFLITWTSLGYIFRTIMCSLAISFLKLWTRYLFDQNIQWWFRLTLRIHCKDYPLCHVFKKLEDNIVRPSHSVSVCVPNTHGNTLSGLMCTDSCWMSTEVHCFLSTPSPTVCLRSRPSDITHHPFLSLSSPRAPFTNMI